MAAIHPGGPWWSQVGPGGPWWSEGPWWSQVGPGGPWWSEGPWWEGGKWGHGLQQGTALTIGAQQ